MEITNAIIWTICVSIIVFILFLWMIICYIGICKIRRKNKRESKLLPVYGANGATYLNGYNLNSYGRKGYANGFSNGSMNPYLNPHYPIHGVSNGKPRSNGYSSSHSNTINRTGE